MQQEPRKSRQRRQKHKYSMILCYGAFINVQRRDLTGQTALKVKPLYESISVQAPVSLDKTTCIKRDSLSTFDHKLDMTGPDPLFQGMVSWTSMEVYLRWAAGSRVIGMQNALRTDATHTHKLLCHHPGGPQAVTEVTICPRRVDRGAVSFCNLGCR